MTQKPMLQVDVGCTINQNTGEADGACGVRSVEQARKWMQVLKESPRAVLIMFTNYGYHLMSESRSGKSSQF